MKFLIVACVLAVVGGVPVPQNFFIKKLDDRNQVQPIYYAVPLPLDAFYPSFGESVSPALKYHPGITAPKQIPFASLLEPVSKVENQHVTAVQAERVAKDPAAPISQEIKLILGIPIIPEGSSVAITVKVDSSPSGPVVSIGAPTPIAVPVEPVTIPVPKPEGDAIIVDANSTALGQEEQTEEIDEEFEIREPPLGENGFENSKDSAFLASMITG